MNPNDCKTIRREIDESELGQELRSNAMRHVSQCSSCREFFESETKLRQMVGSLAPVEAPADFDFKLKARLAQTSSHRSLPWNFSLAIPSFALAAIALIVGGVFVLRRPNNVEPSKQTAVNVVSPPASTINAIPKTIDPNAVKTTDGSVAMNGSKSAAPSKTEKPAKRNEVAQRRVNVVAEDSSSTGARIVRGDQAVGATPAQLIFPVQTLTLSVDDGKGVSRTISFPSVSFGSQRVLAGNGSSLQSANRTNW